MKTRQTVLNIDMISWTQTPNPSAPISVDLSAIDFETHPILSTYDWCDEVSQAVAADCAKTFHKITTFLNFFPERIYGPEFRDMFWQPLTDLRTFSEHRGFRGLRRFLDRVGKIVISRLQADEIEIFDRQYARIRLEIFRYLYFVYWKTLQPRKGANNSATDPANAAVIESLRCSGVGCGRLDNTALEDLHRLFDCHIAEVGALSGERGIGEYDRARVFDPVNHLSLYHLVDDILNDGGVIAVASAHTRLDMQLNRITLHVSRPGDTHIYQTFNDPTFHPSTINMHFDPKQAMVKAILYLNEPTEKDGPFCYVPGSHAYRYDLTQWLAAKGVGVTNYLQTDIERRAFMKLPPTLRVNAILGAFLDEKELFGYWLLGHEQQLDAKWGNIFLFDPNGVHRGGICQAGGERIGLQISMRPIYQGEAIRGF